jgi:hypothetical protein
VFGECRHIEGVCASTRRRSSMIGQAFPGDCKHPGTKVRPLAIEAGDAAGDCEPHIRRQIVGAPALLRAQETEQSRLQLAEELFDCAPIASSSTGDDVLEPPGIEWSRRHVYFIGY